MGVATALAVLAALLGGAALTHVVERAFVRAGREPGPAQGADLRHALELPNADRLLLPAGPVVALAGVALAMVVLPLGPGLVGRDLGLGLFYVIVVVDFVVLGLALAGWGANTPDGVEACYRIVAQLVAYVVPLGLAYVGVIMMARSLSTVAVVDAQRGLWFVVLQPLGFLPPRISWIAAAFPIVIIPLSAFCLVQARRGHIRPMIRLYVWFNLFAIGAAAFVDMFSVWLASRRDKGRIPFGEFGDGTVVPAAEYERVKRLLVDECTAEGTITLARFRDLAGTSRRRAQLLLERFDVDRLTLRTGDARRLRRSALGRAGEALTAAFTSSFVGALFAVLMITLVAPLVAHAWRGYDIAFPAHARTLGVTLVTANSREFRRVSELKIENWLA